MPTGKTNTNRLPIVRIISNIFQEFVMRFAGPRQTQDPIFLLALSPLPFKATFLDESETLIGSVKAKRIKIKLNVRNKHKSL